MLSSDAAFVPSTARERMAARDAELPMLRQSDLGFRVARDYD